MENIDFFFFNFDEKEEFKSGDTITVEMQTIDEPAYLYFNTLRRALARSTGGPFGSTSPAIPTTNWTNNALGYFSAYTLFKTDFIKCWNNSMHGSFFFMFFIIVFIIFPNSLSRLFLSKYDLS